MNKKIIAGVTAIGIAFVGVSSAFANTQTPTNAPVNAQSQMPGKMGGKMWVKLTEAERTQFTSLSDAEKQNFLNTKKAEQQAKKTAQELVIDKLLAGQTLTAEEEKIRQEIIAERAERKKANADRQAKIDQYKAIKAKQTAGETLTAAEQAVLTEMSAKKGSKPNREKTPRTSQTNAQ